MGEQNIFRYLPLKNMLFRIEKTDSLTDILLITAAAKIAKTPLFISISSADSKLNTVKTLVGNSSILPQNEMEFIDEMEHFERIRTCSVVSEAVYKQAAKLGKYIAMQTPLIEGRIELLYYLKEQSVSFEYHRYGSITEKVES
jgi:RHH-type proline utilization regulon transcriptional repressor/proline dehydrogenase/delta 1-pyrroline-5-carboxylate dehydrogenase